uniref:Uncharacterized protein n=1 Tax=Panagrolaimus sp. PS1159 TaxID=55785 RepID=A0AC35FLR1_9BILA
MKSSLRKPTDLYSEASDASTDDVDYTDEECDASICSASTLKAACLPPSQNTQKESFAKRFDSSSYYDVDADSESEDDYDESKEDDDDDSWDDDMDMRDPFDYGEKDPFPFDSHQQNNITDYSKIWVQPSVLSEITVTEAKQRILVCCRDLGISEEKEVRYPDVQKIYLRHYGTALNKDEMALLFPETSVLNVFKEDFKGVLKVILPSDSPDNTIRLTAVGDVRESIRAVENNVIYGILKPVPELSAEEVQDILKNRSRFDKIADKTNLNQQISRQDIVNLRKKGFAKDNFVGLPRVRNPVIKERDEDDQDEFTDSENELDPDFGSRIPQRPREPSYTPRSKTSSIANTDVSSALQERRRQNRRRINNIYDDDSDVWSDDTEDYSPLYLIKEPHGEISREQLNVTTQSSFMHRGREEPWNERVLRPSHAIEVFDDETPSTFNTSTTESSKGAKKRSENVQHEIAVNENRETTTEGSESCQNEIRNEQVGSIIEQDTVPTPPQSILSQASSINDIEGYESEYDSYNTEENEYYRNGYSSDESLGFVGKH